jgi:malic enzyme
MLVAAASTLAALVPGSRLDQGALYPALAGLRQISRAIAIAVAREAQQAGLARMDPGLDAEEAVDATTWTPEYPPPGGLGT